MCWKLLSQAVKFCYKTFAKCKRFSRKTVCGRNFVIKLTFLSQDVLRFFNIWNTYAANRKRSRLGKKRTGAVCFVPFVYANYIRNTIYTKTIGKQCSFSLSRRVCMSRIRILYAKRPSFKLSMYACLLMIRLHGCRLDSMQMEFQPHPSTHTNGKSSHLHGAIYRTRCASVRVPTVRTSTYNVCVCVCVGEIRSIAVKCWCQWVAVSLSGCVSALKPSVIRDTGYVWFFLGLNSWQWRCDNSASGKCHTALVQRLIWKSKTINEQITKNSKRYFRLKIWYHFHEFVGKHLAHLLNIWNAVNFWVVTMWATLHAKQRKQTK